MQGEDQKGGIGSAKGVGGGKHYAELAPTGDGRSLDIFVMMSDKHKGWQWVSSEYLVLNAVEG